jgi:hypothetical protein
MLGVPPPTIHVHLRIIDPTDGSIPGVLPITPSDTVAVDDKPVLPGLASEDESRAFGEWMRGRWADKEVLMDGFTATAWEGFHVAREHEGEAGSKEGLYGEGSVEIPIKLL